MKSKCKGWILGLALSLLLIAAGGLASEKGPKEEKQKEINIQEYIRNASLQNGSNIYYYGTNLWGQRVPISGGPHWLYMHGGGCVQCHGPDGRGGIWPMMCNERTPAITYRALISGAHQHDEGEKKRSEAEEEEHEPYTIRTIQIAIQQGVEPDGKPLNWCMPRWGLSPVDFRDLLAYLVYLGER